MPLAYAWWDLILRLVMAIVLGAAIGRNRERAHKPAGVKTHLMVSLGSALVMMISLDMFQRYIGISHNIDPGRIAAQVITGVGFLGAGTIIHAEGGLIKGLTTAASIWTVAGIGLACGAGMYVLAAIATVLAVASLALVNHFENSAGKATKASQKKD